VTAFDRLLDALRDQGSHVIDNGHGKARAQCPAHDDHNPSLSLTGIDGYVLVCCHAGCPTEAVVAALNLQMADLFDTRNGADYRYPDGRIVHRKLNKTFPQSGNRKGTALFHADRIGDAETVYVPEGEKDVLAIEAIGGAAVCSAMGAGKAHFADWSPLKGKTAIVIADKDKPGRAHAAQVVELAGGVGAASVLTVEAKTGKDAADHIAAGHTLDELVPVTDDGRDRHHDDGPDDSPKLWSALDLAPAEQPRWLATNRLPRAAVSLLVGDEGIGKSLLWVLVVAHITTGKLLAGFGIPARDPGRVILASTEDNWSTVVRPRLEVAGADLSMIRVICVDKDGTGSPIFPRDLGLIRNANPRPDLVVVDCWLDTVPAALNVRDAQQARLALHPWNDIATETDAAIWLLGHSNRLSTGSVRDRYGATYVLRQKARMTIWAMQDEDGTLLAGPEKANGAVTTVASRFTIKPILCFEPTDEDDGTVALLEYDRFSDTTIREHVEAAAAAQASATTRGDANDAAVWLALQLAGGPRWSVDVQTAAGCDRISDKRLRAAKLKCRVQSAREGGTGPWFMFLPQHSGRLPGLQMSRQMSTFSEGTSGTSGTSGQKSDVPVDQPRCSDVPSGIYGTPGEGHQTCACGAQLTKPASIRYGRCYECRTIASNDELPEEGEQMTDGLEDQPRQVTPDDSGSGNFGN
jgi:AAA domain-containing protein